MSSCSEVGLVIHKDYVEQWKNKAAELMVGQNPNDWAGPHNIQKEYLEGDFHLFLWDALTNFNLQGIICKALVGLPIDKYLLQGACYDYPDESVSLGALEENPFNLYLVVDVHLNYEATNLDLDNDE